MQDHLQRWARDFLRAMEDPRPASLVERWSGTIEAQPDEEFRRVLAAVRDVFALGYPMSRTMALHPDYFPDDFRTMIRYGEMYGEVDAVLRRWLDHPEDRAPRCRIRPAA